MYSLILLFMLFLVIGESFAWSTASTLKPESPAILLSSPLTVFLARTIGLFVLMSVRSSKYCSDPSSRDFDQTLRSEARVAGDPALLALDCLAGKNNRLVCADVGSQFKILLRSFIKRLRPDFAIGSPSRRRSCSPRP